MRGLGKPRRSRVLSLLAAALALAALASMARDDDFAAPQTDPAERLLRSLHPDFGTYVEAVHPLRAPDAGPTGVYMALVRPGAEDPTVAASAPFAGSGARNDIVYDPGVLAGGRSDGWTLLLLDHEYFHARHLAGATSLPLAPRGDAAIERHFYEAAAWGYTVEQARAGRYPGLTEPEFREALDRYGEHYRALKVLAQAETPADWAALSDPLLRSVSLITTIDSPRPAAPSHPSGPDRSPAIP